MNTLPKLDFLYFNLELTEENYLNRTELYYNKVEWDDRRFKEYLKACSTDELIYLLIYIYRDKYPREEFDSAISVDTNSKNLLSYNNIEGRSISENKHFFTNFSRKDIISMNSQYHNEKYTDDEIMEKHWRGEFYMQNLFLEFNKEVPIDIIDKALGEKEYIKIKKDDLLVYEVNDSPIASLEITKNSIKLNVNEDKVIRYVSIW